MNILTRLVAATLLCLGVSQAGAVTVEPGEPVDFQFSVGANDLYLRGIEVQFSPDDPLEGIDEVVMRIGSARGLDDIGSESFFILPPDPFFPAPTVLFEVVTIPSPFPFPFNVGTTDVFLQVATPFGTVDVTVATAIYSFEEEQGAAENRVVGMQVVPIPASGLLLLGAVGLLARRRARSV